MEKEVLQVEGTSMNKITGMKCKIRGPERLGIRKTEERGRCQIREGLVMVRGATEIFSRGTTGSYVL